MLASAPSAGPRAKPPGVSQPRHAQHACRRWRCQALVISEALLSSLEAAPHFWPQLLREGVRTRWLDTDDFVRLTFAVRGLPTLSSWSTSSSPVHPGLVPGSSRRRPARPAAQCPNVIFLQVSCLCHSEVFTPDRYLPALGAAPRGRSFSRVSGSTATGSPAPRARPSKISQRESLGALAGMA